MAFIRISAAHLPDRAGPVFELTEERITIGSDSSCDLVLLDPDVATHHATLLTTERGHLLLAESGSTISVGGRDGHQHFLNNGERIELGATILEFCELPAPAQTAPGHDARPTLDPERQATRSAATKPVGSDRLDSDNPLDGSYGLGEPRPAPRPAPRSGETRPVGSRGAPRKPGAPADRTSEDPDDQLSAAPQRPPSVYSMGEGELLTDRPEAHLADLRPESVYSLDAEQRRRPPAAERVDPPSSRLNPELGAHLDAGLGHSPQLSTRPPLYWIGLILVVAGLAAIFTAFAALDLRISDLVPADNGLAR